MLTPQDMQEKKFTKAVFGGYDMREVDDFLDAVVADYEHLYKENAILKGKLKTLADKVEEYRASDDDMRRTFAEAKRAAESALSSSREEGEKLLSAAREESERLLNSAREESKKLLDEAKHASETAEKTAREDARRRLGSLGEQIEAEQQRLELMKERSTEYVREAERLLAAQMDALRAFEKGSIPERVATRSEELDADTTKADDDEPTRRFGAPDAADTAENDAADVDMRSTGDLGEPPRVISDTVAASSENKSNFFAPSREINIGGRNVKVFDTRQKNVFEDIFREEE